MATRADNLEGSCREVLSGPRKGKWRVQYTFQDHLGVKRRLSRFFTKQADAKTYLKGLKRADAVEIAKQTRGLTLAEWFDWLAENVWPDELAENTLTYRTGRFNRHIRDRIGGIPLTRIDPMQVKALYSELQADGVGIPTIASLKRDLVRVFNQAISPYQRVPSTMANPFKLTVKSPPPREAVALTPDQARKALTSEDLDPHRRAMLAVFLLGGLRLSEQMALTRDQIQLAEGVIVIDRAVKFGKTGKQTIGLPKGDKKRVVVVCPTLKALLLPLLEGLSADDYLWPSAFEGKPRMKNLVYATWRTIVKDAKLPAGMSPHDCRLSHINWIEKLMPTVSTTTMKEHIGHAAEGVTEINYTRQISTSQGILRNAMEQVVGTRNLSSRS